MALLTMTNEKMVAIQRGERTLLHEAHELVVNEHFMDIPEAVDFLTDPENPESLMTYMIGEEQYEECSKMLIEKLDILKSHKRAK